MITEEQIKEYNEAKQAVYNLKYLEQESLDLMVRILNTSKGNGLYLGFSPVNYDATESDETFCQLNGFDVQAMIDWRTEQLRTDRETAEFNLAFIKDKYGIE